MILARLLPQVDPAIDLDHPDARKQLADLYRPERDEWLRLNLVATIAGSAAGPDGTSESLTNPADRMLLGVIRTLSDVVLVGAATVRAEGYFVPRTAALAIVTGSGDLTGASIATTGVRGPLLVLCPPAAVDRVRNTASGAVVIEVPATDGRLSASNIVGALRDAGYGSIVCEGGPSLAAQLVDSGVVDEICLSTSPVIGGAALPVLGTGVLVERRMKLTQLLRDDLSGLYARWSLH